ncbi:MAG: solute symporter family protein [Rubrobacteraceae bacterium]
MNVTAFLFFVGIVIITLGITYWASKRNKSTSDHYVAGKGITGWQNGLAITGDFVSVGGFLGITGAIALQGFNGFYLSYGIPIAFLLVLLMVAEPMRNLGKYTVGDVITSRFRTRNVRAIAAVNTLMISIVYMIGQFVGAGALIQLLLGINYNVAVVVIGVLASIYILAGGMLATTWIQIFKAVLLLSGTFLLLFLVLSRFGFNPVAVFDGAAATFGDGAVTPNDYGGLIANLDVLSITIAVALGPVGLPHLLMRFLTVPDARTARSSVAVASVFMGLFFMLLPILGYGAALYVGQAEISSANPAGNLAAPQLSEALGGDLLLAFIAAVSFATLLAVMAGIVIAASGAFAHDLYTNVWRGGQATDREQLRAARISAGAICAFALVLALGAQGFNLAFLATLAFAMAASANLPVILLTIYWSRFNLTGAVSGMVAGLASSVGLVLISPNFLGENALFPFTNPALVSIPVGFIASYLGTLLGREGREGYTPYKEIYVRSNVGSEEP